MRLYRKYCYIDHLQILFLKKIVCVSFNNVPHLLVILLINENDQTSV
jgi:hypothetical protein